MNSPADRNFHPDLEPVLRRLRGRIRRVQSARGVLVTLVAALAVLLALIVIDERLSPLPPAARWILTLTWFASVAGVALTAWLLPMRKPPELLRIARWLEVRHPELDERISTALELSGSGGGSVSGVLLEELSRAAVADLAAIDPRAEISMRRARRWLVPALVLLAGWTALFVWAPQWTARHVVRALVPNSRLGNTADGLAVEPGSVELIEGDALKVTARFTAAPAVPPEIELRLADGKSLVEPLAADNGAFIYQLDRVAAGFDYEIRAGRAVSDRFRVMVWPKPRLADARLRLEYPAYTGLAPREQAVADGLSAVAGTKVSLHANLNTPVSAARFGLDGGPSAPVRIEHSAAGGSLDCGWTLARPGRAGALLTLSHRLGRDFEGARFEVETLEDAVPEVKWTRPAARELKVRPDEVLDLVYQASDDFGPGEVAMEVKPGDAPETALPQPLPEKLGKTVPPLWRGEIRQPVGDLRDRWPGVSVFKLRMRVADARPPEFGGPNKSVGGWITVRLDREAEPLARQELFSAHNDARETLEKARREIEEARWRIEAKRDELRKGGVKESARDELEKTREQLAKAGERLEELASRMEETPHAPKAEAMREAAAKAEQAREKLENTPLQDSEQAREQMAAAARDDAAAAEQQLRELLEKIQRDEPRLHDLARLQDLAQRQNELARQAEQAGAADAYGKKEDADWRQRQGQASWELRDLAGQHPQARAEALAKEAAEARELAAEAREQAAAQQALKEQAAGANQGKSPVEGLREGLAKEQAAIRDEANKQVEAATGRGDRETANTLPEAADAAAKAAEALAKPDPAAGVEATAAAAKEMAAAARAAKAHRDPQSGENHPDEQSNGDSRQAAAARAAEELGDLAERQRQVAEAAKELAAGHEDAARRQLAGMRAEQAADLAKDIREAPQVGDAPGAMQQAANAANQAAGHASDAARQTQAAQAEAPHGEAAAQLQQAAASLDQAAAELSNQASQAANQAARDNQAPMPGKPLAEAFHEAAEASHSPAGPEAATHARAAANALNRAARDTRNAMRQGQGPPNPGAGEPGQPAGPNAGPGTRPDENPRPRQADPGVPPELAKLGISADDWEQIKSSLKAESGGKGAVPLPEEYRDLVRKYFEQMTKGGKND